MARQRVLGPEHPATLTAMGNLAVTLGEQGNHAEAERSGEYLWVAAGSEPRAPRHPDSHWPPGNHAQEVEDRHLLWIRRTKDCRWLRAVEGCIRLGEPWATGEGDVPTATAGPRGCRSSWPLLSVVLGALSQRSLTALWPRYRAPVSGVLPCTGSAEAAISSTKALGQAALVASWGWWATVTLIR